MIDVVRCHDAVPEDLAERAVSDQSLVVTALDACTVAATQVEADWMKTAIDGPDVTYLPSRFGLRLLALNDLLSVANDKLTQQSYDDATRKDLQVAIVNFRLVAATQI